MMRRTAAGLPRRLAAGFLLGAASTVDLAAQPPLERIEEKGAPAFYRLALENGLIAVIDSRPGRRTVHCEIGVRVGSRHETLAQAGVSHLLEHLLFKEGEGAGSRKNPAFSKIRAAGGVVNATTGFELTNYFCDVHADAFEEGWRGLANLVTGLGGCPSNLSGGPCGPPNPLAFGERDVEIERSVVLEEAASNKSNPASVAAYSVLSRLFPGDPLSNPIIGFRKSLARIRHPDAKAHYGRFYTPQNSFALVVGDVEPEQAARLIVETLGLWRGSSRPPEAFPARPRVSEKKSFVFRTLIQRVYYVLGAFTPGQTARDRVSIELLRRVLGEGKSSRLYRRLVEEEALTSEFIAQSYDLSNLGILGVGGAVDPGQSARFQKIVREEFERIAREPVGQAELERAKRMFVADMVRTFETNGGIASFRSRRLLYGQPLSRDADLDEALRLTPQDLLASARLRLAPGELREIEVRPARGLGKVFAILRYLLFRRI